MTAVAWGILSVCSEADSTSASSPEVLSSGLKLYGDNCASCHGADGAGISNIEPALTNDIFVCGDPTVLIRLMIEDPAKVLTKQQLGRYTDTMPDYSELNDKDTAAILTYIRYDFGPKSSMIEPAQVTKVRVSDPANQKGS
jgi:mono/diheme cytochrome c family protein